MTRWGGGPRWAPVPNGLVWRIHNSVAHTKLRAHFDEQLFVFHLLQIVSTPAYFITDCASGRFQLHMSLSRAEGLYIRLCLDEGRAKWDCGQNLKLAHGQLLLLPRNSKHSVKRGFTQAIHITKPPHSHTLCPIMSSTILPGRWMFLSSPCTAHGQPSRPCPSAKLLGL